MHHNLLIILSLLFTFSMFTMLSAKLKIANPIIFVIAGLIISFIPNVPQIRLDPDIVFLFFLPPLLFSAAWNTSWGSFWENRAVIGKMSFSLVILTSSAIAVTIHFLVPGFSWALGFLLGAIISPPDAIAATSVLQNFNVSKKVVSILEGESLINDTTSLIIYRVALTAFISKYFSLAKAPFDFVIIAGSGILIGIVIGYFIKLIFEHLPTTPDINTAMTLLAPYIMYLVAEYFNVSGVMAVISGGLLLSASSHRVFKYNSRLQVNAVWNTVNFLLNGFVFILIGLQLSDIVHNLQKNTIYESIGITLLISLVTILVRVISIFPLTYSTHLVRVKRKKKEIYNKKEVLLVGWIGMRGVVSLASALSIPLVLPNGADFPERNLILFITFGVILITLVLQGISLPVIIRLLHLTENDKNDYKQDAQVRMELAEIALHHLNNNYSKENSDLIGLGHLKSRYEKMKEFAHYNLENDESANTHTEASPLYQRILVELVEVRRKHLSKIRKENSFSDEVLNIREKELDHEEARLSTIP